jgi:hypothetical protein
MSSKRKLKKDINYVTFELLAEAFTLRSFSKGIEDEKFESVLSELVNKRNDLIARINHPVLNEKESPAQYYSKLRTELNDLVLTVEQLSK